MPIAPWDQPDVEMVPSRTTVAHAQSEELNFLGVPVGRLACFGRRGRSTKMQDIGSLGMSHHVSDHWRCRAQQPHTFTVKSEVICPHDKCFGVRSKNPTTLKLSFYFESRQN